MIYTHIDPKRHAIILDNVQSYMERRRIYPSSSASENIMQENVFRMQLYSEIAELMPTYAWYVLTHVDAEDDFTKGIREALTHHIQDRQFVDIVLQYLNGIRDTDAPKQKAMVGALFIDTITRFMNSVSANASTSTDDAKKKDKKDEKKNELTKEEEEALAIVEPARIAAANLLGGLTDNIKAVCPEISDTDAMFIGGCRLMDGQTCIKNIYEYNIPITADVFNVVIDDAETFESILRGALLLEASAFQKNGSNQKAFIDSLKRWVYSSLNMVTDPVKLHRFLTRTYQSLQPNDQTYLIHLRECGPTYGYLLNVAKQVIVDKK